MLLACYCKKKGGVSLPPASRAQELCPSSTGTPVALPRNHWTRSSPSTHSPALSLLRFLTLKAKPWKIVVELLSALPSATSNPGPSRHARASGQYIIYNCWSVTSEDVASGGYGHSPMKCKFNVTICNVKCFAL